MGEEAILLAKKEYRKEYKRQWRENRRSLSKCINISITLRQYQQLKLLALKNQTSVTALSRQSILKVCEDSVELRNTVLLKQILQAVSMSINEKSFTRLHEIESMLIEQITNGNH